MFLLFKSCKYVMTYYYRPLDVNSTSVCVSAGKLTQIVFGHRDVVTCLARSESYIGGDCYVLSGSRDATLLLWYWNGKLSSIGDSPGSKSTHTHTYSLSARSPRQL